MQIFIPLWLIITIAFAGPEAFVTCMKGLEVYLGGSGAALAGIAAARFPL
jgi:hypothetical protein